MNKNPASLAHSLYQIGAIQFGDFQLKSGQRSPIYLDLRRIISFPTLLQTIANRMWEKISHCEFDLICGVPYTALPIATALSLNHQIPMVMCRKEKKSYGTQQMIEGAYQAGQTCLLIEDVITTGGSLLTTAEELEKANIKVTDMMVLIDRLQGKTPVTEKSYRLHTVLSLNALLQELLDGQCLTPNESIIVNQWLKT